MTKTKIASWQWLKLILCIAVFISYFAFPVSAEPLQIPNINLQIGGGTDKNQDLSQALQLIIMLTVLTLAPAILILLTSFTRIIVVLSFIRSSLGTQQMPPNQILIGLALFLTFFVMAPTLQEVNREGSAALHEGPDNPAAGF